MEAEEESEKKSRGWGDTMQGLNPSSLAWKVGKDHKPRDAGSLWSWKKQGNNLPWSFREATQSCRLLDFRPVRPVSDFGPQSYKITNECILSHCLVIVSAAVGN